MVRFYVVQWVLVSVFNLLYHITWLLHPSVTPTNYHVTMWASRPNFTLQNFNVNVCIARHLAEDIDYIF